MNGRIDFDILENGTPFFLQDKIVKQNKTTYDNLKFTQQNTHLSNLFFSTESYIVYILLFLISFDGNTRCIE
jgi:hypothetical protein